MLGTVWPAHDYSWAEFTEDARALVTRIREDAPYEAIYAIPRGGLVLGVYLSHVFNIPLICGVDVTPETLEGPRILVVDDNTITGESLVDYERAGLSTAVLLHCPDSAVTPTYFAREFTGFPVFPWEQDACAAHRDGARVLRE